MRLGNRDQSWVAQHAGGARPCRYNRPKGDPREYQRLIEVFKATTSLLFITVVAIPEDRYWCPSSASDLVILAMHWCAENSR